MLDEADSIAVEGFSEVNILSVLLSRDRPFSGVNYALSSDVHLGLFSWVLPCFCLSLLVSDNELVLFHAGTESFAEGELGMSNDVWFRRGLEFVDRVWTGRLGLVDWSRVGCHVLFVVAGVGLLADCLPDRAVCSHCVSIREGVSLRCGFR
jgi:hypothetical protein